MHNIKKCHTILLSLLLFRTQIKKSDFPNSFPGSLIPGVVRWETWERGWWLPMAGNNFLIFGSVPFGWIVDDCAHCIYHIFMLQMTSRFDISMRFLRVIENLLVSSKTRCLLILVACTMIYDAHDPKNKSFQKYVFICVISF